MYSTTQFEPCKDEMIHSGLMHNWNCLQVEDNQKTHTVHLVCSTTTDKQQMQGSPCRPNTRVSLQDLKHYAK